MPYNVDEVKGKVISWVRVYRGSVIIEFTDGNALDIYTGPAGELCHEYLKRQVEASGVVRSLSRTFTIIG